MKRTTPIMVGAALVVGVTVVAVGVYADTLSVSNTFKADWDAKASEVNQNFDDVEAMFGTGKIDGTNIDDGSVTSSDLSDGTILNADINASAGIATSKIAWPSPTPGQASGSGTNAEYLDGYSYSDITSAAQKVVANGTVSFNTKSWTSENDGYYALSDAISFGGTYSSADVVCRPTNFLLEADADEPMPIVMPVQISSTTCKIMIYSAHTRLYMMSFSGDTLTLTEDASNPIDQDAVVEYTVLDGS